MIFINFEILQLMKQLFILPDSSIKDALKQLNKSGEKCLVVVDKVEKFLGTLSDGDVRKAILKGKNISETIRNIFNKNATCLNKGRFKKQESKDIFLNKNYDLIPVINNNGIVVEILISLSINIFFLSDI